MRTVNRPLIRAAIWLVACATVFSASTLSEQEALGTPSPAAKLSQTGLYSDFAERTINPRNIAYSPQYPLWSDGAKKRRWVYLPPGEAIDSSDPDVWTFPVGTKIWKEFSFNGRPVETRLMEQVGSEEWKFESFAWNEDGSDAVLAPPNGLPHVAEIQPGLWHDIPGVRDCQACHLNRRTEVLGFSALQVSPDRDPNAPNAELLSPGMVSLATLIERKLLRSFPQTWLSQPPRIEASEPNGRPALGYLHANCGNCHNPGGALDVINLILRHSLAPGTSDEPAVRTAVNRAGRFRIPGAGPGETFFIRPGDPAHSSVLFRMSSRNPFLQMPPLGTKLADAAAVDLIRRWILLDLPQENGQRPLVTTATIQNRKGD